MSLTQEQTGTTTPGTEARPAGHQLIATVHAKELEAILQQLRGVPKYVQMAEVRLDALWEKPPEPERATNQLLMITEMAPCPLMATLRPRRQGGQFSGSEQVRLGLLVAALEAGFDAVDLEADNQQMAKLIHRFREKAKTIVVSRHLLKGTIDTSTGMQNLTAMQDMGADLQKLAFTSGSYFDTLRSFEYAYSHHKRGGRPVVAPMGQGGAMERALLPLAGNCATYAHAPGAKPAAQGQPSVQDVVAIWKHWGLSPKDLDDCLAADHPWYAVIGGDVRTSLSPRLHNAALRAAGRPERYGALNVPPSPGAVRLVFHVARRVGLAGLSVTNPHKLDAARASEPDEVVRELGAANCVRFDEDGIHSTNTDASALGRIMAKHAEEAKHAVILGSGGVGRSAARALHGLGIPFTVCSRNQLQAKPIIERWDGTWHPWDERTELEADIWIQATSIGSRLSDPAPVDPKQLRGAHVLLELVYTGGETRLERAAKQHMEVVPGRTILMEQAVDSYRHWFQEEPDRQAMAQVLEATK